MKINFVVVALLTFFSGFAQEINKKQLKAEQNANNLVYKANELLNEDNYVEAEMEYRKAISEAPSKAVGAYNLAHSYFRKGSFEEALFRSEEAAQNATSKDEKHRAYHNIGNILMQNKMCKEAVEAYKNALRNNPTDEETRYNFALAKECAEQQQDDGGGEDNKEDENQDSEQDKEDQEKKQDENKDDQDKKDEGDQDKKDGDKEEDENGKPKDDKKDDGKGDKEDQNKNQQQKPKPGQMSPQQIKNILEAMQNQEQKVQEKMNAEKQKGAKVKTEKDW
ncbi:MAG: aerotolerance regulator BatC [Flavobacteriaceae bacterium]|nr:aerotolerance regulator BatC [Flavobacteriaceae bacterium]|tara:strand:+ start:2334 stop:3170 length:837 start_codon:yes stop_codon:yes gene_type:complete